MWFVFSCRHVSRLVKRIALLRFVTSGDRLMIEIRRLPYNRICLGGELRRRHSGGRYPLRLSGNFIVECARQRIAKLACRLKSRGWLEAEGAHNQLAGLG